MHKTIQIDYHKFHELTEGIDQACKEGNLEVISIISQTASGKGNETGKMHRMILLAKESSAVQIREKSPYFYEELQAQNAAKILHNQATVNTSAGIDPIIEIKNQK